MTTQSNKSNKSLKFVQVIPEPLIRIFKGDDSLSSFIHWSPIWVEKKKKFIKKPVQKLNKADTHLSLVDALSSTKYDTLGLAFTNDHQYIALDVDGVDPNTTPSLKQFLDDHPTYIEASPSGIPNRIRVIYKLINIEDKKNLKAKTVTTLEDQTQTTPAEIELFNNSNNYTTLTGQELNISYGEISIISTDDIIEAFPSFKAQSQVIPINNDVAEMLESQHTASLIPAKTWINTVPLHRDNSKLNQVINRVGITYYEFWLQGIMCIHSAWGTVTGFAYADEWSQQSGDDYDIQELKVKWESFDNQKDNKITRATYQWLFSLFSIDWPVMTSNSKTKPKVDEIDNFRAFLKHQGLTLDKDAISLTYFLTGEAHSDVFPRYYPTKARSFNIIGPDVKRLASRLQRVASGYAYRPQIKKLEEFIITIIAEKFPEEYTNRFAQEISNRPLYNPNSEPDYLKLMARSIIQKNPESEHPTQEFHDTLIRKWLLSLGRTFWPDELSKPIHSESSAEGVLILSDKSTTGGINKSSLGVRLLPTEWRHLYSQSSPGRATKPELKEYYLETTKSCLIDWDEVDGVINSRIDGAALKSLITAKTDTARTPYDPAPTVYPRRYSLMASTNKADLAIPEEGVRRFWWLNVRYIDTYKLDNWDMYNLWRQIRYELKNYDIDIPTAPWILTDDEKDYLSSYLVNHRTTTSLKELLLDMYDWSEEGFDAKYQATISQNEKGQLKLTTNNPLVWHGTMSLKEIKSSLSSEGFTGQQQKYIKNTVLSLLKEYAPKEIHFKDTSVQNGIKHIGKSVRYFMPALRNDELMRESATLD